MYVAVVQPAPPPPSWACRTFKLGCPAPVVINPDALASILTGSPATALQQPGSGLSNPTGMSGCSGGCKCGGKCNGMGDTTTDTSTPGFFQQLTDPLGSDLSVLNQQLANLNAQTAAVNQNIASSNWGTWVLVGLGGLGAWWAWKSVTAGASALRQRRAVRQKRTAKRARLKAELAAL